MFCLNICNAEVDCLFRSYFSLLGLMQQLTDLNISGCHLQNLEVDIKSAEVPQTYLRYVDLSHNYLRSLPTSFMNLVAKNLVTLNINGKSIMIY